MAPSQLGMFARSTPDVQTPDLQWHVQPLSLDSWDKPLHPFPGMTCAVRKQTKDNFNSRCGTKHKCIDYICARQQHAREARKRPTYDLHTDIIPSANRCAT